MLGRLREMVERAHSRAEAKGSRALRVLAATARLNLVIAQQLVVDQAPRAASALAFTTLTAMVPLFAVSFAVLKAFVSSAELAQQVQTYLMQTIFTDGVGEVATHLEGILERAQGGAVGLVGFVFLLGTSISLFMSVEETFNRIWRVPTTRPFHRRLVTFYAVITLSPALIALGFVLAGRLQRGLESMPFGISVLATVVPVFLAAAGLTLMYRLLPHAAVRWRPALIGGVAAAILFELSKWGFNKYVHVLFTGSVTAKVYGSMSLIPVFCLWVYLVWLLILGGVELSYIAQNHRMLTQSMMSRRGRTGSGLPPPPTGYFLSRAFFEVSRHFAEHGGGVRAEEIARRLQVPLEEVEPAVRLLRDGALLLMVDGDGEAAGELVPARPPDRVKLAELYALSDRDGYHPGELPESRGARRLEERLRSAECTTRDLLQVPVGEFLSAQAEAPAAVELPDSDSAPPPPMPQAGD